MTTLFRKLLSGLLALTLILSLAPAAFAEETSLQLSLTGLYACKDGTYASVAAAGSFDVYQDGRMIGTVNLAAEGGDIITLPGSGDVSVIPVAGTIPAELPVSEYGYGIAITEGRQNIAPITVYANAGLFKVCADYQADFELLDAQGETVLTFRTDADGIFALEQAIPAGAYTLRMVGTAAVKWPDQTIEIVNYTGKESVLKVTAPADMAAQAAPTAAPTEVPAPAKGTLVLSAAGESAAVTYSVSDLNGNVVAQGSFSPAEPVTIGQMAAGEYHVSLQMPAHIVMTGLNSNATMQRGLAQWKVAVEADQESNYVIELTGTGSIILEAENVSELQADVHGERESAKMVRTGESVYGGMNLLPGAYTVSVLLPQGRYVADGWTLTANADGSIQATAQTTVQSGVNAQLPAIKRSMVGSAAGVVYDTNGAALPGVQVTIYGANGAVAATATTDGKGAWQVPELAYGEYVAQYADSERAIPAGSFTLSDSNVQASLSAAAAMPARIKARVFVDDNNNGSCEKNEKGMAGAEVALVDASGTVVDTGVTDADGYVTLSAAAGKYSLRATLPADYGFGKPGNGYWIYTESVMADSSARTQQSAPITLETGKTAQAGIGAISTAIVKGTVWQDLNADGIWQSEEPGVPGVRMTLSGGPEKINVDVYTDANGVYEFHQVHHGIYDLICHVPDEQVFTVKASGKQNQEAVSRMTTEREREASEQITLDRGEVFENFNIGMMKGAIIEGVCFVDQNYNGVYDEGDTPMAGVELRLARQSNNVMLQTVFSDENGVYRFVGQRGSTFTLRALLHQKSIFTKVGTGENANVFPNKGGKNEYRLTDITLENGGHRQLMVGAISYGSISGRVYFDNNFSTQWEKGEMIGEGYYVVLYNEANERVTSCKTDKNGLFEFNEILPGDYYLTMTPEKGYAFTALGAGNVMQVTDEGKGRSCTISLASGEKMNSADIGMIVPAYVSGVLYADHNDNGLQDKGENGLEGAVVRLMSETGEVAAFTMGESAAYRFSTIPGRFYLQFELPQHGAFGPVVSGGNAVSGADGIARTDWFEVSQGYEWTAPVCGGVLLSDISGAAFTDSNGNAVKDADEPFFAGLTITLTPSRSDLSPITVVTGADGAFALNNLRPDAYTLTVACPGACVLSRLQDVNLGLVNGLGTQSIPLNLKMGTQWHNQYLGCVLPSTWTGEAYMDEDYDGIRDADDAPAVGEIFILRDANTGADVMSVKTDESGVFTIEGIAPGEYELVYPLDEGNLMPKDGNIDFHLADNVMTTGRVRIVENQDMHGTKLSVARTTEIGGMVWLEQYSGVTPVAGATVHLLNTNGEAIAEYVTGEDGRYVFKGLMPGDFAIDATIPAGYVMVENNDPHLEDAGLISVMEDVDGLFGRSQYIQLRMARHCLDMNVGMVLPGRLGDKAWLDLNGNGLQDGDEGGIPGIGIELIREDRVVASTVTDQYGYYVFEDLYPTEYTLRVTWPAEVKPTMLRPEIHQISSVLQENGTSLTVVVESNKANYAADLGFILVEEGKLPAGYGEGETQNWKKSR